ncbi:MAG: hypothetical protein Q4G50_13460 [Corynebacterium sp.]|uniref:hypothetical protein n=1 Tax=Corynebacterium sp. TaxID=1720 RepID=UPI0026E0A0F0|nr:hypothetical protein [Corynebacterium sp.]MDO5670992.1 hypothetical protein [Corynebacterium sp.]
MDNTRRGVLLGLVLAFATIFGGWGGLLYAVLFGAVGGVIGAHCDGRLDLMALARRIGGRE